MKFDDAFIILLGHEGRYSNNPSDPGGETMYGITKAVARASGYTGDMKELPESFAKTIYRVKYWDAVKADELPANIRFNIFDGAVNSGVVQSTKWLQRAIGVKDDGVIGPITLAESYKNKDTIVAKFNSQRLLFMTSLSTWSTFGKGWTKRIAKNLTIS